MLDVLEDGTSTLVTVGAVRTATILIRDRVSAALRKCFCLVKRGCACRCTHLVVHKSLADSLVASECDVTSDARLVLVQTGTEILLPPLRAHHLLLLLLLLGKVQLVDSAVAVLRSER